MQQATGSIPYLKQAKETGGKEIWAGFVFPLLRLAMSFIPELAAPPVPLVRHPGSQLTAER